MNRRSLIPPQSNWDRDPKGTYRIMMKELNRDVQSGYVTLSELKRFRRAINKCYLKGMKNHG